MNLKHIKILLGIVALALLGFRLCCGLFVIQPIGAIPEGTTIAYWRIGTNFDFIESPDGLVKKTGVGLSLWTRAIALGTAAQPVIDRELFRLPYMESLYLITTDGESYDR